MLQPITEVRYTGIHAGMTLLAEVPCLSGFILKFPFINQVSKAQSQSIKSLNDLMNLFV
jgi:hypothetical protein